MEAPARGEGAPPAEKGAQVVPGGEEEQAVPDLAQGRVDQQQDGLGQPEPGRRGAEGPATKASSANRELSRLDT